MWLSWLLFYIMVLLTLHSVSEFKMNAVLLKDNEQDITNRTNVDRLDNR